jgi:hypothetical protein
MTEPAPAPDPVALMEAALTRTAEFVGDITAPVIARLYVRCPEARRRFVELGLDKVASLEAEMVENTLFALMNWLTDGPTIAIMLGDTVPHHMTTLEIELGHFTALVEETAGIVLDTIPADRPAERAVWERIRDEILEVVTRSAEWEQDRIAASRARAHGTAAAGGCPVHVRA